MVVKKTKNYGDVSSAFYPTFHTFTAANVKKQTFNNNLCSPGGLEKNGG